jgi:arsenate reductase
MNKLTIYINPACSNCRTALSFLEEKGIEPEIIEYLTSPLTASEYTHLINLGITPSDLIRTKETAWQQLKLDINTVSTEEIIDILIKNPSILQRPIIVSNDKAIIARPPEKILDFI